MSEKGFRTSAETAALYEALASAQGEFPVVEKGKTGKVQGVAKSSGKEFSYTYKYADIADVFKAVLPVLSKYKLCIMQPTCINGDVLNIVTHLAHSSGQWIESDYPVCSVSGDHQRMAGALTYAKRQASCALVGIVADEDTDGVEADVPSPRRPPPPPKAEDLQAKSNASMLDMMREINNIKTKQEAAKWAKENEERKGYLFTAHADAVSKAFRKRLGEIAPPKPPIGDIPLDFEKLRATVIEALRTADDIETKQERFKALTESVWKDLMPPDQDDLERLLRRSEAEVRGHDEDGVIWSEDGEGR